MLTNFHGHKRTRNCDCTTLTPSTWNLDTNLHSVMSRQTHQCCSWHTSVTQQWRSARSIPYHVIPHNVLWMGGRRRQGECAGQLNHWSTQDHSARLPTDKDYPYQSRDIDPSIIFVLKCDMDHRNFHIKILIWTMAISILKIVMEIWHGSPQFPS